MVLQAGLAALLSRLGAGPDIAMGSPIAGRGDGCAGGFGWVLRQHAGAAHRHVGQSGLCASCWGGCGRGNLAAYSHQDLPFERLVEVLNPQRSLSRHPLFQVMLAFQSQGLPALELAGLRCRREPVATASAKFDLSVSLSEHRAAGGAALGIEGVLEYAGDLFDRGSVAVAGGAAGAAAGGGGCGSGAGGGVAGDAVAAERAQLLSGWNDTARPVSAQSLPELFAAQARRTPEAVAVVCGERRLSYAALRFARQPSGASPARARGGPETVVGLCVERSPEMVIGLLGILEAGGAYLPLDPHYPAERLAFMLSDAGAPVLVGEARLLARLPAHRRRNWCGSTPTGHRSRASPTTPPTLELEPQHPAYVIYTSGSTGTPKGVVVGHAVAFPIWRRSADQPIWRQRRGLAYCQFASLSFRCRNFGNCNGIGIRRDAGLADSDASRRGAGTVSSASR